MTLVYLIRHGETDWNREEVFRGRADRPLSPRGLRQADSLGRALGARPIDAVVASPLRRATETAAPVAHAHALAVETHEGLNDLDFGSWQGQARQTVRERQPEMWRQWETAPQSVVFPGGESLADVSRRADSALRGLVERLAGKTVAVVTHRVVLKVLIGSLFGGGLEFFWRFRLDTTSVTTVRFERSGPVLESFNDTAHLTGVDDEKNLGDF